MSDIPHDDLTEAAPFAAGTPVEDPARFFGRQRERKRLFALLARRPLQNAVIIGPRRSGKTSLLHYLKNRPVTPASALRPDQQADCPAHMTGHRFAFVDFQDPRMGTRQGLLRHLLRALGCPGGETDDVDLPEFMDRLCRHLHVPAVVLLDEIGVALGRYGGELDDSFWEGLRSMATNQTRGLLGFVLAAHESPRELACHSGHSSPFFNIFGSVSHLGPLSEDEARKLISSSPAPILEEEVCWILEQSGRWPILLQVLCRERILAGGDRWQEEGLAQIELYRHLLDGEPAAHAVPKRPTLASLRKLLDAALVSDSDLDAFCLDHFREVRRRFSAGMDRVARVSLLLEHVEPAAVLARLREDHLQEVVMHQRLLRYE